MARKCQLLGKKTSAGQNRPFSLKATKRTFRPNLFSKRVLNPLTGRVEKMKLSAKAIRTLKKWARAGQTDEDVVAKTTNVSGEGKHVKKEKKLTPKQKKEEAIQREAELLGKEVTE
jgi:large subunit ribosomal protein L28